MIGEILENEDQDIIKTAQSDNPYNLAETSLRDSYNYPDSMFSPWNPDDLVQKQQDYSLYEDMLKDDQVSVCLQIKKDLVLSSGFDFIMKEDGHEEIVEDLKIALEEDPEWSFEEMIEEIISAYEFGFSVSEKVFKLREDGKLSLKFIKTRYPGTWLLHTDEYGNVSKYEQRGNKKAIDVPKQSLIHYINKRKFQNPYGVSDLRPAYQAWFTKKHITRWYAIFIEKAASPIPIAKYDKQATRAAQLDIYNAIKNFQTKTAMAIPSYVEVEFLEAKSNGEAFTKGINIFNMFIGRSLLIPDLLGFQGAETSGGSYSLGKTQMEIFFKHIRRRRELLEKVINNEIVWPIVLHNFGYVDNYPKFKFRDISKDETIDSIKLWLEAAKLPFYRPSDEEMDHFRNIINFPISDKEAMEEMEPSEEARETLESKEPTDVIVYPTKDGGDRFATRERRYQPASGSYGNKTDFNLIEKQLDTALDSFLAVGKGAIDGIFQTFIEDIDRKKIIQRQKVDKLDALALKNVAGLRQKLYKALLELYKKSKEVASSELFKSKFAKPIVAEEFLKILDEETYQFIGDWEYNVTKGARLAIIQAIKDGKSIAQVVDIIDEETKLKSITSLETYARTKFTEVMNKGRIAFFEESKVISGYQYSAILDDRTTEICRGLHGKTFLKGDQPIPPMHFNAIVEGSLIKTKHGFTSIEEVKAGDYVLTHLGNYKRVYDTMSKFEDKEYFEIELENERVIKITGEHPVLTQRGWIRTDSLLMADDIMCLEDI